MMLTTISTSPSRRTQTFCEMVEVRGQESSLVSMLLDWSNPKKFTLSSWLLLWGTTMTYSQWKEKFWSAATQILKCTGLRQTLTVSFRFFPLLISFFASHCFVICHSKWILGGNVWFGLQWLFVSLWVSLHKVIKIRFGLHCQVNKNHFLHSLASTETLNSISSENYNILGSLTLILEWSTSSYFFCKYSQLRNLRFLVLFFPSWTYLLNSSSQSLLGNLSSFPTPSHLRYSFHCYVLHLCLQMNHLFISLAHFTSFSQFLSCATILGQELQHINTTAFFIAENPLSPSVPWMGFQGPRLKPSFQIPSNPWSLSPLYSLSKSWLWLNPDICFLCGWTQATKYCRRKIT